MREKPEIASNAYLSLQTVFRKQKGSKEHTGAHYWVGERGIDGAPRGNKLPYVLPVRHGSHPSSGYKNIATKTGYQFKFDLKTKGNMFGPQDNIRLQPTFYFVDKEGKRRQKVDIYYHSAQRKFVKIGSKHDTVRRNMVLDARLRNQDGQSIVDTAAAYYNLHGNEMTKRQQAFIRNWAQRAKKETYIGGYHSIRLPKEVRTFLGPLAIPDGVDPSRAFASIQQWHGEYHLPSKLYIVPEGFDLSRQFHFDDTAPFFLQNGYLIVNFNIETLRNGKMNHPHLQYINAPLSNQWKREGFAYEFADPYGIKLRLIDGDVLFYHADRASTDDFKVTGTH
ncbi:hypothetical protein [Paenibacillus apiarius]|uniref:hypothetical protein n=1 Tax=Paenibacillus apiarius TaxID=46240 RepID=UPI003B3BC0A3